MLRYRLICAFSLVLLGLGANLSYAQIMPAPAETPASSPLGRPIDGVAARIEDDVITESEVRELAAYQQLVDGKPKTRDEIMHLLFDQWMIRSEAAATKYAQPSSADVDRAYNEFVKQFPSVENFKQRCADAGLSEPALRRMIAEQLYLARFMDYRFRPAAQVTDQQVAEYYQNDFVPQLKARHADVPPLDDVEDTIREVLILRVIDERSTKWLDETRARLKIDLSPTEGRP